VGHIARAAGVAHGTFYVHFASKDEALDALLGDFNHALADKLAPVLAAAPEVGLKGTVRACATAFIDHWASHRTFVASYAARVAAGADPKVLQDGLNPPMESLLLEGLELAAAASGTHGDWSLATHGVLGMWLRVGLRHVLGGTSERQDAIDVLSRATVGALTALLEAGPTEAADDPDPTA
jgi:AcrR family transcriptional regulator